MTNLIKLTFIEGLKDIVLRELADAGFHVVEIASPMLGAALLDDRHGTPRTMVV